MKQQADPLIIINYIHTFVDRKLGEVFFPKTTVLGKMARRGAPRPGQKVEARARASRISTNVIKVEGDVTNTETKHEMHLFKHI